MLYHLAALRTLFRKPLCGKSGWSFGDEENQVSVVKMVNCKECLDIYNNLPEWRKEEIDVD